MPSRVRGFWAKLHLCFPSSHHMPRSPQVFPTSCQTPLATASSGHAAQRWESAVSCLAMGATGVQFPTPTTQGSHKIPTPAPSTHTIVVIQTSSAPIYPQDKPINLPFSPCDLLSTLILTFPPPGMKNSFFSPPHPANSTHFPGNCSFIEEQLKHGRFLWNTPGSVPHKSLLSRSPRRGRDSATNDDTGACFCKNFICQRKKSNGQLKPTSSLTPIFGLLNLEK